MGSITSNDATAGRPTACAAIRDLDLLRDKVAALRAIGAKVVLTQGTFDLLHIGHAIYLEQARSQGDVLIVGVDSDEKVRVRKGPDRPIVGEVERMQMLTHLRHVDLVVLKTAEMPRWALIKLIRPDVLVATRETYSAAELRDLREFCDEVIVLDPQATTSTSARIRRLNIRLAAKIKEAFTSTIDDVVGDA